MTKTCENRWRKSVDFLSRHLSETRHFNSWLSRFMTTIETHNTHTLVIQLVNIYRLLCFMIGRYRKAAEIFDTPLS